MSNEQNNDTFCYTYSAKQRAEINNIRQKYLPQDENKLEQLRRLDASVTQKGTTVSLIFGILGTLLMGIGMCCCMVWMGKWFVPGIVIGVLGIVTLASAYPLYANITKKERDRIAPEIIRLTEELLNK